MKSNYQIYLLLLFSFIITLIIVTVNYNHYQYCSDGFHYYVSVRNFVNGYGTHEGIVFEYLLGNHFFATLFLFFLPFILLKQNPIVMLYGGVFIWHLSAFYYYLIIKNIVNNNSFQILLTVCLYIISPIFLVGAHGWGNYCFQMETFLALFIMMFTYYYSKKNIFLSCLSFALLIFTKEEYIPLSLLYFINSVPNVFISGFHYDKIWL